MLWLVLSLICWILFGFLVGYTRRLSDPELGEATSEPLWPGPIAILLVLGALAAGLAALVAGLPIWAFGLAIASALLATGMILWAVRDLAIGKS